MHCIVWKCGDGDGDGVQLVLVPPLWDFGSHGTVPSLSHQKDHHPNHLSLEKRYLGWPIYRERKEKSLKSCSMRRSSPQFKPPNNGEEHWRRIKDCMAERTQCCLHLNFY